MGIIGNDGRYDVFFSYAHDDAEFYMDWLSQFHDQLKSLYLADIRRSTDDYPILKRVIKSQPNFFWDQKGLPANGDIDDELQKAIENSEFLFVFIGKKYPKSDWCGKEVDWFVERLREQGKDDKDIYRRLFIILMERDALDMSWGDAFLAKAKEKSLYQSFLDKDGRPISPVLDEDNKAIKNPAFSNSIRNVAETLVERTSEILSQGKESEQTSGSSSSEHRVRGVTIGAISHNLENAVAELQKQLEERNLRVDRITLDDLSSPEGNVKIKDYLSNSAFFIQPFDFAKVWLPLFPGGHLFIQEQIIKSSKSSVNKAFWRVSPELGGIEASGDDAENSEQHTSYLANISKLAHIGNIEEVAQYVVDRVVPVGARPGAALPTVFIENAIEDEKIMCLLIDKLKQLWEKNYGSKLHLECTPVPWSVLRKAKEDTLKACHGIIMIYGTKDPDALLAQIISFNGRLNPLSPHCNILGRAVAWAPPRTPRHESIGYPINFNCEPTDHELKVEENNVEDFLKMVFQSFELFAMQNNLENTGR